MVENKYRIAKIPKNSNGYRLLEIPSDELKTYQKEILNNIIYKFGTHKTAHGFKKNHSPITNAKIHRNSYVIIKLDIKDFFSSTKQKYVISSLARNRFKIKTLKTYSFDDIKQLSESLTRVGHLPTGSPTSPALGNIVMYSIDYILYEYCISKNLRYTRYADDITISSVVKIPKYQISAIIRHVKEVLLSKRGYKINKSKIRVFSKKNRMEVTGIVVNNNKLTISKKYRNNVRAAIHQMKTKKDLERINGRISWIMQVHPKQGKKLLLILSKKLSQTELTL